MFEVIGVGVKVNDETNRVGEWHTRKYMDYLHSFDWAKAVWFLLIITCSMLLFFNWRYNIRARLLGCTLCIARALHGVEVGGSLAAVADRYRVGVRKVPKYSTPSAKDVRTFLNRS